MGTHTHLCIYIYFKYMHNLQHNWAQRSVYPLAIFENKACIPSFSLIILRGSFFPRWWPLSILKGKKALFYASFTEQFVFDFYSTGLLFLFLYKYFCVKSFIWIDSQHIFSLLIQIYCSQCYE